MTIKQINIIAIIAIITAFVYFFIQWRIENNEDKAKKFLEFNAEFLLNLANEERLNALAISTIISHNVGLKQCIKDGRLSNCKDILENHITALKDIPLYKNIKIHLHSADLKSIVRSWDDTKLGDDLSGFRSSLKTVRSSKKPISGVEIGRCGTFTRGISPILDNDKLLGSVEVMLDFTYITEVAKKQGVNLFIIIDDKYKTDCFYDKLSPVNNYILLNQDSINLNITPLLNQIDLDNSYTHFENSYFYSKKIYDLNGNFIGYLILHMSLSDII